MNLMGRSTAIVGARTKQVLWLSSYSVTKLQKFSDTGIIAEGEPKLIIQLRNNVGRLIRKEV